MLDLVWCAPSIMLERRTHPAAWLVTWNALTERRASTHLPFGAIQPRRESAGPKVIDSLTQQHRCSIVSAVAFSPVSTQSTEGSSNMRHISGRGRAFYIYLWRGVATTRTFKALSKFTHCRGYLHLKYFGTSAHLPGAPAKVKITGQETYISAGYTGASCGGTRMTRRSIECLNRYWGVTTIPQQRHCSGNPRISVQTVQAARKSKGGRLCGQLLHCSSTRTKPSPYLRESSSV